ncbi:hypothetical protein GCM10010191_71350 [Actinomadura vinacea]|uniref:Type II toxin-antitoxin system RelE/ParE family toxin n=1 Tax=Actinomadura vinacea TaxID=115336 RepID=A0ABN3JYN9_9ACTN
MSAASPDAEEHPLAGCGLGATDRVAGRSLKEGLAAAAALMVDPHPADSRPDPELPDTYLLERGHVRVFYRVVAAEVDVAGIWPNS